MQFAADGHVLGFGQNVVYIASRDHALRVQFANCNQVQPVAESGGTAQNGAAQLGSVSWSGLWNGVNVVYNAAEDGIVESTYYLNFTDGRLPVESIRLRYNRPLSLDESGNLVMAFDSGWMTESAPRAWQVVAGVKRPVEATFILMGEQEAGFALKGYLPGIPVVVDPTLTWNTFLGGGGDDGGRSIAVDAAGNVYVAGYSTDTWGSPVQAYTSGNDAYAAKLNSGGTLIWNTFMGGSGDDYGYGIAMDASGNVYVTGYSNAAWGSPVRTYTSDYDAFAAKLNGTTGALAWNTFLGGSGNDRGRGIAVDGSSNVYVAGYSYATWGSPVRVHTASCDAFAARLDSGGALAWNTFLGGNGYDVGYDIAVDAVGNVYVTGYSGATWGSPVRDYSSGYDAFAARLNSGGALAWNTFLGGNGYDVGYDIAVDAVGNVYVTGYSDATWGSPVRVYTASCDAFAVRLDSSGTLIWNTFLGGRGDDVGFGIAVDVTGNVCVAGHSDASWGSPVRTYTSDYDAFAAKLNGTTGALAWNTFLGGSGNDYGRGIAVDATGNVYVAGESGSTWGSPVRNYTSSWDAFAVKIQNELPAPTVINVSPDNGQKGQTLDVVITGTNFTGATALGFGNGITVNSFTVVSATQIRASITIATSAATGARDVSVTAAGGTDTLNGGFTVTSTSFIGSGSHGSGGLVASAPPALAPIVNLPNIQPQSAVISAARVQPGQALTVTAVMANKGNAAGTAAVKLYINGHEEATQGITVNGGSTAPVSFTVSRDEPGTYSVYVNGTSAGSFTVDGVAAPNLVLYISAALILTALAAILIMVLRRKRTSY
ncbi:MAG: SBBP repeat-containing protein [Dehalococcoidia bacterium]